MYRSARPGSQLCMISNAVLDFLFNNWGHLLRTFQQNWLSQQHLEHFANMVYDKGAPLDNCWGFVDGTVRAISRPGIHQRRLYNGHKRYHALKFQSVVAPNGLIANLYGPVEGKRHGPIEGKRHRPVEGKTHDSDMLMDSGLSNQLQKYSFGQNQRPLCIYEDPAYPLRVHLQAGFKGTRLSQQQVDWNTRMSEARVSVEWIFGNIITYFKFLDLKKKISKLVEVQLGKCILYVPCYKMQRPVYMETQHLRILIVSPQQLRSILHNYLSMK